MKKPHRAFEVTIKIGADTWAGLLTELDFVHSHLNDHDESCDSIMGGPTSNHSIEVSVDRTIDHDRYHKELKEYLDHTKSESKP